MRKATFQHHVHVWLTTTGLLALLAGIPVGESVLVWGAGFGLCGPAGSVRVGWADGLFIRSRDYFHQRKQLVAAGNERWKPWRAARCGRCGWRSRGREIICVSGDFGFQVVGG